MKLAKIIGIWMVWIMSTLSYILVTMESGFDLFYTILMGLLTAVAFSISKKENEEK